MSYLRRAFLSLVKIPDTPERTALAFSVGTFLGFSPFLGLHTLLGVGAAFLFRLNKVAVMLGVWSNVPWIVIPYYGFSTWLGIKILGTQEGHPPPSLTIDNLMSSQFWFSLSGHWRLLFPAVLGSMILSVLIAMVAYPIALFILRRYRET